MYKAMKKLFYLLALPLLFVACEPGNIQEPPYALTLTSEASLTFEAEGGNGVITYVLEGAEMSALPGATCEAEWITDLVVGKTITFSVEANEGEARQTKIKVAYSTNSFEVTIRQQEAEEVVPTLQVKATDIFGSYFAPEYVNGKVHLYSILLSDSDLSTDNVTPGGSYFYFDVYADSVNADYSVPAGTYTFDRLSTKTAGTIDAEGSLGFKVNSTGTDFETTYIYHDATVVVTEGKLVATITLGDASRIVVTYEGSLALTPEEVDVNAYSTLTGDLDVAFEDMLIVADNYGDYYGTADADNWLLQIVSGEGSNGLSDSLILEFLADNSYGGWDLEYDALVDFDFSNPSKYVNSFVPGFVEDNYLYGCWYMQLNSSGSPAGDLAPFISGSIAVELEGNDVVITLDCKDDAGHTIAGTVSGTLYTDTRANVGVAKRSLQLPSSKVVR